MLSKVDPYFISNISYNVSLQICAIAVLTICIIAEFLGVPEPNQITDYYFRRCLASLIAQLGSNILPIENQSGL